MSDFDIGFGASPRLSDVIGLGVLTRVVDRDTVDDVLGKAGRRESRVWLLPARVVVYLVLALCLFTSDGYDEVVRKLTNGLRGLRILSGERLLTGADAAGQIDWTVSLDATINRAHQHATNTTRQE